MARAKALDSFVKKMIRKRYNNPSQVTDKAGVRVVCLYEADRIAAMVVTEKSFKCSPWENKRDLLKPNELGYLGVHSQLTLLPKDAGVLTGLECELQLHTVAAHAWSAPLHDLIYKPPEGALIPDPLLRAAYRLAAMTEVYDGELSRTRESVLTLPGYKYGQILRNLDVHFYSLTDRDYDRELSAEVIQALEPLYGKESADEIGGRIEVFVSMHHDRLLKIYAEYDSTKLQENAFMMQPESIMLFERIENDPFHLREKWTERFEERYLEPFFNAWGVSLA